jgi:acetolactate synthase-1/2/3 large subunit
MGPVFWDIPMDVLFPPTPRGGDEPGPVDPGPEPDPDALSEARALLAAAERPVLVLGGGVWMADAVEAAQALVAGRDLPVISNGMGRGVIPPGDPHLVTRARGAAFAGADLVLVAGTPLDFRLGFGVFGTPPATVVHLVDAEDQRSAASTVACTVVGDLRASLAGLAEGAPAPAGWAAGLREAAQAAIANDAPALASGSDPIHPARIYGELMPRLARDAVTIGDGGDFVSFAGKYIEPGQPGSWLDPGPFGCLGTGLGYALAARVARPGAQVTLLLGDGAAGFSLMDVDTLVRHQMPVVMVVGNNSGWGLERGPMRMLHGYEVATDLAATSRYDEVVRALGGAGEIVTDPGQVGPALDRAYASGVPYLVNVVTDPEAAYPRSTTGI